MSITEYLQHHPIIAFSVGVVHLTVAKTLLATHVPDIVMQLFQIGAWAVTITVGLITIYGFFKKKKR